MTRPVFAHPSARIPAPVLPAQQLPSGQQLSIVRFGDVIHVLSGDPRKITGFIASLEATADSMSLRVKFLAPVQDPALSPGEAPFTSKCELYSGSEAIPIATVTVFRGIGGASFGIEIVPGKGCEDQTASLVASATGTQVKKFADISDAPI
ncbi:hypothetical protein HZC07_00645 [Candidatus Micrarchaeota archaeon]|nr:hypothetical protein [Candidatus Micrarchaeota archaeon]